MKNSNLTTEVNWMTDDDFEIPDDVMAQELAEREQGILEASQTLERIARKAARQENPSLSETEMDLGEAKVYLGMHQLGRACLLYTSPSPRDGLLSRMPSSA